MIGYELNSLVALSQNISLIYTNKNMTDHEVYQLLQRNEYTFITISSQYITLHSITFGHLSSKINSILFF